MFAIMMLTEVVAGHLNAAYETGYGFDHVCKWGICRFEL